ncbi:MAG: histidinol phosphate aminotransferase [Desulfobulbus propionicus]|nr:MAG: histidinol phosphate aminotransferase [Desulfobulbus propionicus]
MIKGHGGNINAAAQQAGCHPDEIIDMSSNINPLGMPPGLLNHLRDRMSTILRLPEVDAGKAVEKTGQYLGVEPACLLMGTGTTQFIYSAVPALAPQTVLIVGPTYADYASSCQMYGIEPDYFFADPADEFKVDCRRLAEEADGYDLVFLCNPNNPTGHLIPHDLLLQLCSDTPTTTFIIDESYLGFASSGQDRSMISSRPDNVVVLWSLSKLFCLPGLRAGFLVAAPEVISRFSRFMQPWCANSLSQEAVLYLTESGRQLEEFVAATKIFIKQENVLLRQRLADCLVELYPTVTPYTLIALPEKIDSSWLCKVLLAHRLLIRDCSNFSGLSSHYVRVSLKKEDINRQLAELLLFYMKEKQC